MAVPHGTVALDLLDLKRFAALAYKAGSGNVRDDQVFLVRIGNNGDRRQLFALLSIILQQWGHQRRKGNISYLVLKLGDKLGSAPTDQVAAQHMISAAMDSGTDARICRWRDLTNQLGLTYNDFFRAAQVLTAGTITGMVGLYSCQHVCVCACLITGQQHRCKYLHVDGPVQAAMR